MRNKNALRQHSIQDYVQGEEPKEDGYLLLAKWITSITDDTQEETEDFADYAGDGTPSTDVTSVSGAYSVEGTYDSEDEAQALVASKKYETGSGRKVWHKVTSADGKTEWEAVATLSGIVAGGGDASAYEDFSCNIRFDHRPKERDLSGE